MAPGVTTAGTGSQISVSSGLGSVGAWAETSAAIEASDVRTRIREKRIRIVSPIGILRRDVVRPSSLSKVQQVSLFNARP